MKQYKVIVIGAGGRGTNYAKHMKKMPDKRNLFHSTTPPSQHLRQQYAAHFLL